MSVSPPGHWLLNRMVFLLNRTLGIINTTVFDSIKNLLKDANTFTGINTFMGGINVDNIDSINGNTTFNSEIIVNSNITANNGSFIGDNLVINNIEKYTNSNVTFQSNINMNNNDIDNINTLISGNLYINNIDINTGSFITVNNEILFNKGVQIDGDLSINGSTITVNTETLTVNDRFIVLNANIESSGKVYTDSAGFIVKTHNASAMKNEGYFFWSLETPDGELNRTWDLSGDNLRGNVLKARTLRGNIIDSYYSPNISVISHIDMNNKDITNITSLSSSALTATDLNIDVIKTNTAANITVISDIDITGNLTVLGTIKGETGTICKIITYRPSRDNPSYDYKFGAKQQSNSINLKFENYKKTKHTNNIVEIKSNYTIKGQDGGAANNSDNYYGNLTFIDNNSTKIFTSGDFSLLFFSGGGGGGGHRSSSLNDIYLYVDDEFESNNITIELNLWTPKTDDIFSINHILFIVTEIWK